jgi:signal transduction histidine kinase
LQKQLVATDFVSRQNVDLRRRAVAASSRATAQTERAIRRIGFDLHDGPAQYLSLASLRLDGAFSGDKTSPADAAVVRDALSKALDELRIISRGLALPDLDSLGLFALTERAIHDHQKQTGMKIETDISGQVEPQLNYTQKLCAFRFLQETLSNATRHGKVDTAKVFVRTLPDVVELEVRDAGAGFDSNAERHLRDDGGQGLFALADRVESIGGKLKIESTAGHGTRVTLILPKEEVLP